MFDGEFLVYQFNMLKTFQSYKNLLGLTPPLFRGEKTERVFTIFKEPYYIPNLIEK
jgi:hypothetical protein